MLKTNTEQDCGRIIDDRDPGIQARYRLNDIFCGAWLSHAVRAAIHVGIPQAIDSKPRSTGELADELSVRADILYRLLRALAANGVFIEVEQGVFAHNEVSRLLRPDHPYSWRAMASMWGHPACLRAWEQFPNSLYDGRSGIEHAYGKSLYEYLHDDLHATVAFSNAMISNSAHTSESLAAVFPFAKFDRMLDLGGGIGTLLFTIMREHPRLKGAIFEVPDLADLAIQEAHKNQVSARFQFISGNFLHSVPSGFDLYFVKNSLWNWQDDSCLKIMRNVREAIGESGSRARFVIAEYVIDEKNARWTCLYDLQILNLPGGRARTHVEYERLLQESGFAVAEILHVEDQTIIVADPV